MYQVSSGIVPTVRLSVECRDQIADRWPRVRRRRQRQVPERAVAADDGVGAELVDVLGRPVEPATGPDKSRIHPDRAYRPHLAVGASLGTQQSVERPVGVGDDIEGEFKVRPVGGEPLRSGEGDDGDVGVAELVEVVAHGDHVFLAGQSSEVPVQHQNEWSSSHLDGAPGSTLVVDEFDIGQHVADVDSHGITQVRPRRSAECSIASTSRSIEPSQVSRSSGPRSVMGPASVSATTIGTCPPATARIGLG